MGTVVHEREIAAIRARIHLLDGNAEKALELAEITLSEGELKYQGSARTQLLLAIDKVKTGSATEGRKLIEHVAQDADAAGFLDLASEAWKALPDLPKTAVAHELMRSSIAIRLIASTGAALSTAAHSSRLAHSIV
ncbi:hypothetical protein [Streptomyces canus]|uniref:hypothetical protein n=1 Tax=Streptomyces canus TaxID=58343 RepID=UPI001319CEC3|nr:hypothetical protein [Streptomyces canus]